MNLYTKLKKKLKKIIFKDNNIIEYKNESVENTIIEQINKNDKDSQHLENISIYSESSIRDCNIKDNPQLDIIIRENLDDIEKEDLFYEEIDFIDEDIDYTQQLINTEYIFKEDIEIDEINFEKDLEYVEQLKNNISLDCNYNTTQNKDNKTECFNKIVEIDNVNFNEEYIINLKEEIDFSQDFDVLDSKNNNIVNSIEDEYKDIETINDNSETKTGDIVFLFYTSLIILEKFILMDIHFIDDIEKVIQIKLDLEKSVDLIEDLLYVKDREFREILLKIQESLDDKKYLCYCDIKYSKNQDEKSIYLQENINYYIENIQNLLLELYSLIEYGLSI